MFTKNFNSLPDSLIEASKKIMTESEKMSTLEPKKRNSPSSDHDDYDHEDDYERDEIKRHQEIMDAEAEREERKKMSEASNEAPNIQRLTLTQTEEPVNEISVGLAQRTKAAATARLRNPNVQGAQASKAQRVYSLAARKVSGDVKIRATGNNPTTSTSSHSSSSSSTPTHSSGSSQHSTPTPYKSSYSMIKEPPDRSKGYGSSMPQRAAASPVKEMAEEPNEEMMPKGMSMKERTAFHNAAAAAVEAGASHFKFGGKEYPATMSKDVASKMNEESINEDDRRAIRKEIDKARAAGKPIPSIATVRARLAKAAALKAKVRSAKDAYKEISKQAKSPKSGLAPLKTSVTPKEHESEDSEESARKHPIDRLRRIALSMKGGHFEYDNGEKHHISRDVARAIVKHYEVPSEQGGLKPFQKEKLQGEITKSHDHLMKHYNSISGTNEDAYVPKKDHKKMLLEPENKKNKKELDEVPIETIDQVRTYYQNEESDDEKAPYEPDNNAPITWKKCDREAWVAGMARDAMKKKMKTEEEDDVTPGAKYAKKVVVPEAVKSGHDMAPNVHLPEGYISIGKPGASLSDVASGRPGSIKQTFGDPSHSKKQKMDAKPSSERKPLEDRLGEENINEREMSDDEMTKREKIVKILKTKMKGFKKRYGKRAKDVMYATATKMAMKGKDNK